MGGSASFSQPWAKQEENLSESMEAFVDHF